jgi:hypothetical protein
MNSPPMHVVHHGLLAGELTSEAGIGHGVTVTGATGVAAKYWHAGSDPSVQICPWLTGTDGI